MIKLSKGQSVIEYAILISVLCLVFFDDDRLYEKCGTVQAFDGAGSS